MAFPAFIKRLFPLLLTVVVLTSLILLIEYFSHTDDIQKRHLFSNFEVQDWVSVQVQNKNFHFASDFDQAHAPVGDSVFYLTKEQTLSVKEDFRRIYVVESATKIDPSLAQYLHNSESHSLLLVHRNKDQTKLSLYPINTDTGYFWMKLTTDQNTSTYYLCESDVNFEGFYKTAHEGKILGYYHFKRYFTDALKKWWGQNFWRGALKLSLTTKKNVMFSIDVQTKEVVPSPNNEVSYHANHVEGYLNKILQWVPDDIVKVTADLASSFKQESNFYLKFDMPEGKVLQLLVLEEGFFWEEKNILLKGSKQSLEGIIILGDQLLEKRLASLAKDMNKLFEDSKSTISGKILKTGQVFTLTKQDLEEKNFWKTLFCLVCSCENRSVEPFMRVQKMLPEESKRAKQRATFYIDLALKRYYFLLEGKKVEVLTPESNRFIFISSIDLHLQT